MATFCSVPANYERNRAEAKVVTNDEESHRDSYVSNGRTIEVEDQVDDEGDDFFIKYDKTSRVNRVTILDDFKSRVERLYAGV